MKGGGRLLDADCIFAYQAEYISVFVACPKNMQVELMRNLLDSNLSTRRGRGITLNHFSVAVCFEQNVQSHVFFESFLTGLSP
jgi:hypothetical protein